MMPRLLVGGCDVMQNYEKKQGYVDKFVNKLLKLKKTGEKTPPVRSDFSTSICCGLIAQKAVQQIDVMELEHKRDHSRESVRQNIR